MRLALRVAVLIAALAAVPLLAQAPADPDLDQLLARATWYALDFVHKLSNVVAEERYIQDSSIALNVDVSDPLHIPVSPYWRMLVLDEYRDGVWRLSPLLINHVNVLGRYEFALKESVRQGQLRPLRDPDQGDDLAA